MSFSSSSWYAKNLNLSEHCVVLFGIVLFLRKEPRGRMPSSPSPSSSACRAPTSAWPAPGSGPSARRAQSESDPIRVAGPSPQAPPCRPRSLVCRRQPRRHSSPFPFNPPSRRTPPPPFPFNPPSRLRRTPPRTRRDGRCLPTCTYIPPPAFQRTGLGLARGRRALHTSVQRRLGHGRDSGVAIFLRYSNDPDAATTLRGAPQRRPRAPYGPRGRGERGPRAGGALLDHRPPPMGHGRRGRTWAERTRRALPPGPDPAGGPRRRLGRAAGVEPERG